MRKFTRERRRALSQAVIPRLAKRDEGPLKRSNAFAKYTGDNVRTDAAHRVLDATCNCEVPRRLRGSG